METIADRLKKLRKNGGYTQLELAEKTGYSRSSIINWERGLRAPDIDVIRKLASVLNVTMAYLTGETDSTSFRTASSLSQHTLGDNVTLLIYEDIPPEWLTQKNDVFDGLNTSHSTITLPPSLLGPLSDKETQRPFFLKMIGDSMERARIYDGQYVLINPMMPITSGDPSLVIYDGHWAIKMVYWNSNGGGELRSATTVYPVRTFSQEDLEHGNINIVGPVLWAYNRPRRGV